MRSIQAFSPTRRWLLSAAAGVGALAVQVGATDTRAQEVEAFYKGKTINLMDSRRGEAVQRTPCLCPCFPATL